MAEAAKRKKQEKYHTEYYHRYMDMRAIAPSFVIALIWSLAITFYIPASAITAILAEQTTHAVQFPILTGLMFDIIFRGCIFIVDFILVFLICYFVLWVVWREKDKMLMLQMKKKRQI